ncbi:protein of unknown function [Acetitomaculum ruminis DSM 5522]|uniref:DUF3786 domain-containing protein n=1 Tax=Acetitomaculum ruminis DSM 5522 TaxID=1120918 RepID=A0A1I0YJR9_9FIRM|nr:DUF3786 domain-containing protein [Acetitomaculum ruminis]SFB12403.1 protein of unknown function [Acetitomaculum ruminis DSM 5522]
MDVMKTPDNYLEVCELWRKKFLTWDYEKMMKNLNMDDGIKEDHLEIVYFGIPYYIDKTSGIITNAVTNEANQSFETQMAIYHLLYYAKENPINAKEWIPFRQVEGAGIFDGAFQKTVIELLSKTFSGHLSEFIKAGEKLGFIRTKHGDAGFIADVFRCVQIEFIFWDGDDEYPANANILFDKNITQFTHAETVVLLASEGVKKLIEAAGL